MNNRYTISCILISMLLLVIPISIVAQNEAQSQNEVGLDSRRFEIGFHFTNLSFGTFDPRFTKEWRSIAPFPSGIPFVPAKQNPRDPGVGARFTYNINKNVALESETNWYFQKEYLFSERLVDRSPWQGGQKLQMLFGPKIGYRNKRVGVFGKVRPGFIHFVSYPVINYLQQVPPGEPFLSSSVGQRATFFNVDVGGVFEYYPNRKTVFRVDVGDTIIRYNAQEPKDINPTFTRHNLQLSLGFGFRF